MRYNRKTFVWMPTKCALKRGAYISAAQFLYFRLHLVPFIAVLFQQFARRLIKSRRLLLLRLDTFLWQHSAPVLRM